MRARDIVEAESAKSFIRRKSGTKESFNITSSHGRFTVKRDGVVLAWHPFNPNDPEAVDYLKIVKFNISEYVDFWEKNGETRSDLLNASNIDILDVGFWQLDGSYEPPDMSWRKEMIEIRDGRI